MPVPARHHVAQHVVHLEGEPGRVARMGGPTGRVVRVVASGRSTPPIMPIAAPIRVESCCSVSSVGVKNRFSSCSTSS